MAGVTPQGGFENMVRDLVARLARLERGLGGIGAPKLTQSTSRPEPSTLRVGLRLFETDTNRSIFVNATQDGYVDATGTAL